MPRTVVTPFERNRYKMRSTSSGAVSGLGKWPCISVKPGSRNLPCPSTTREPRGAFNSLAGPMLAIRPSETITVCPARTRSLSMGSTLTSSKQTVPSGAPWQPSARTTAVYPMMRLMPCLDLARESIAIVAPTVTRHQAQRPSVS